MATISYQIPDDKIQLVIDAVCSFKDYETNKLEGETRAQFTKRKGYDYYKEIVRSYEEQKYEEENKFIPTEIDIV